MLSVPWVASLLFLESLGERYFIVFTVFHWWISANGASQIQQYHILWLPQMCYLSHLGLSDSIFCLSQKEETTWEQFCLYFVFLSVSKKYLNIFAFIFINSPILSIFIFLFPFSLFLKIYFLKVRISLFTS